jgi:hypothetical protein
VIRLLRTIGVLGAALWFGAAVFAVFALGPASESQEMRRLLGPTNFPFYSRATEQVVASHYGGILVLCALLGLANMVVAWLYFGKLPNRLWLWLFIAIASLSVAQAWLIQPRLTQLHRTHHAVNVPPPAREKAGNAFRAWQTLSNVVNYLLVAGLAVNLLRVTEPEDPARFVSAVKFKS